MRALRKASLTVRAVAPPRSVQTPRCMRPCMNPCMHASATTSPRDLPPLSPLPASGSAATAVDPRALAAIGPHAASPRVSAAEMAGTHCLNTSRPHPTSGWSAHVGAAPLSARPATVEARLLSTERRMQVPVLGFAAGLPKRDALEPRSVVETVRNARRGSVLSYLQNGL
mmetsp:Transcript_15341/g.49289  ORF Transcript_15341/g.49289 Transcript_15341/m.49289 type:complete len:170 (+) Transcript_15341:38-547(+)